MPMRFVSSLKANYRGMIILLSILSLLVAFAGCAVYDPQTPVYDTADNPDDFSKLACNAIDQIESGEASSFDQISQLFADLYDSEPSLLLEDDWQKVIKRLGARFKYFADTVLQRGAKFLHSEAASLFDSYTRAADYYRLAALANPSDSVSLSQAILFGYWSTYIYTSDLEGNEDFSALPFNEKLELLRFFVLHNDKAREFAGKYLLEPLFEGNASLAQSSTDAEWALLSFAGCSVSPPDDLKPIARFVEPSIDFVAIRVDTVAGDSIRFELYFTPRQAIANDYTIAFWVNATNAEFSIRGTGTDHFPFDFEPYQPTSNWPVDSVSVAYQTIAYDGPMFSLTIGFYRIASGKADFISIDGADKELLTVPLSGQ